jgi:type I restriction enzyme S subunit
MSSKTKTTVTKEEAKPALVPKLRFPEFRGAEGWKPVALAEASTPVTERVGERKLTPVSISAGIGFVPQAAKFGRDISGNQYQLYTLVRGGDFVFNKGNSLKFPQGCVYQLQGWGQVAAPNVFICFRLKKGYSDGFFQQCFEQNQHGRQLKRHITSGARSNGLLNISKETFFGVEIPTPNPAEQQKIAECLSSVDELMAAQARKVDALKTHKKGLMQQLFPREGETQPRLRFPEFHNAGEWEENTLDDIATFRRGSFPQPYGLPEWYDEKNGMPFIQVFDVGDDFRLKDKTKSKISKLGAEKSVFIPEGTLIVTLQGSIGRVAVTHYDAYIDRTLLIFESFQKPIEKVFFARVIQNLFDIEKEKAPGGIIKTITKEALSAFTVKYPTIAEQQRIADCLTSLDDLIAAQTHTVEALKTHKKGLMQQLFPSPEEATP